MLEEIGEVWAELFMGSPLFMISNLGALLFVVSGDWGSLVLALGFGYAWSQSDKNLFVVGLVNEPSLFDRMRNALE